MNWLKSLLQKLVKVALLGLGLYYILSSLALLVPSFIGVQGNTLFLDVTVVTTGVLTLVLGLAILLAERKAKLRGFLAVAFFLVGLLTWQPIIVPWPVPVENALLYFVVSLFIVLRD